MSELAENVDGNLSFAEKSAARHAKLKAKWSSQRAEGDVVEEETASAFWGTFSGELAEATRRAVGATSIEEVQALETVGNELRAKVGRASAFLKPYDVKRATAETKAVADAIGAARDRLAPRKRFGFSSAKLKATAAAPATAAPAPGPEAAADVARTTEREVAGAADLDDAPPGFRGLRGAVVEFAEEGEDELHLADCRGCVVFCARPLCALRLLDCRDCFVFVGAVNGPCYCIKARGCHIRAAPRQLRVHDTHDTTFHVAMASGPIIEGCSGLRFARYAATWDGSNPPFDAARPETDFKVDPDAWAKVKDFKWLKAEQSPHWAVLPDDAYGDLDALPAGAKAMAEALHLALLKP